MGHGGFLMRRLENVRGVFSLTALAYNIRRATTLVGIPELIDAWGVQTSWNRLPQGPVATHQGAWHQRIDDNPLTAQIPGLSHRKIRLGPTFHTASLLCATDPTESGILCLIWWRFLAPRFFSGCGFGTLPRPGADARVRRLGNSPAHSDE